MPYKDCPAWSMSCESTICLSVYVGVCRLTNSGDLQLGQISCTPTLPRTTCCWDQWKFFPTHVLFDYQTITRIGGLLSANFPSPYSVQRVKICERVVSALFFTMNAYLNVGKAHHCNTISRQPHVLKNMPMLFAHLQQLEAAGRISQAHVSYGSAQPATTSAASLFSSLALMHAMKSQALPEHATQCRFCWLHWPQACSCSPHPVKKL